MNVIETIGDQARPPVVEVVACTELVVAVNVVKPRGRHHRSEGLLHGSDRAVRRSDRDHERVKGHGDAVPHSLMSEVSSRREGGFGSTHDRRGEHECSHRYRVAAPLVGVVVTVVACSIVIHGITVTPVLQWYERSVARRS